jgi:hypothetical protein
MGMLYFRIFAGRVEQAFVPASEDSKDSGSGVQSNFRSLQPDPEPEHLIWCEQDWPWQQAAGPD